MCGPSKPSSSLRHRPLLEQLETRLVPASVAAPDHAAAPAMHPFATGPGAGYPPQVKIYDATSGTLQLTFFAYDSRFQGGVRVAMGDVNGDGVADVVTAPGPGGGPDIRVFDGRTGKMIQEIQAFDPRFLGGAFVATADFNKDAKADIVVGADAGGGPEVKVFSGADGKILADFYAYDPAFRGGVRVAAGNVNGDGTPDVVTGAGPGGRPQVRAFDGTNVAKVLTTFDAYPSAFTGGVYVAAGNTDGDARAEIITGPGAGMAPLVKVFAGDGTLLRSFTESSPPGVQGGAEVGTVADINGNGSAEIITASGPGGVPFVTVRDGRTLAVLDSLDAYPFNFNGGVFVGGG